MRPKSILGVGAVKLIDGGSVLRDSASAVLIRLAAPAAITMWPTLLLSEPIAQKLRSWVWRANARVRPSISIGSPSGVAVPCASTYDKVRASIPAASCAAAITCAWPSGLGAVKLARSEPSLLTAAPSITA